MPMMTEAIDREDWELIDKGKPPREKVKPIIPEPKFPKIDDHLKFNDILPDQFESLVSAKRRSIRNEDRVVFNGYDVIIKLKRKAGRPSEKEKALQTDAKDKLISGWMVEGDFLKFFYHFREKIDLDTISW